MHRIHVVNKDSHAPTKNDFYIGRGSILGNPFTSKELSKTKALHQCSSKKEAIQRYKEYFDLNILNKDEIIYSTLNHMFERLKMGDIYLVCYCSPKECHGDIIKDYLSGRYIKFLLGEKF